ncbi:MAG TPA: malto-oligosyltrehalose synthase, partial [Aldersonia sp.]
DPRQNAWWWDVLTLGRGSNYADWFDIDWRADNGADGKLALPVLGSADDLAELTIDRSGPAPLLAYHDRRFPVAPGTDGADPVAVHDRQAYRLVGWRDGISTYRRFFTINELAALRQEDPRVFEASHVEVARWCAEDLIDGVRVDHPDGLADPAGYLARLRELIGPDRLLVIEKILADREALDPTLPVDGTTGYDAMAAVGGVLLDQGGEEALTALSSSVAGAAGDAAWLHAAEVAIKRAVAASALAPDVRRMVGAVSPGSDGVFAAAVEVASAMPVYRSDYASLSGLLGTVVGQVEKAEPTLREPLGVLSAALGSGGEARTRFEQLCGAVTAKSVEDCLFYRTARLVSLQEVGGAPGRFGWSPTEFHLANAERVRYWPRAMTSLSTHDTKRGEDVRARIGVLSQIASRWADTVTRWVNGTPAPDGATALFLLQNMFGVWPVDGSVSAELRARLHAYAEKAIREAGRKTTWNDPDAEFESAVHAWIDAVIDGPVGVEMSELVAELAQHFWSDSLAQKLLAVCAPGIPDTYQGTERWEDSLVDPDNRRPVDTGANAALLESLSTCPPVDDSGAAKLWLLAHALWLRRDHPDWFAGAYRPLFGSGDGADHLVAYARGGDAEAVVAVARHTVRLAESGWGETTLALPPGRYVDRLTGAGYEGQVALADLFAALPVALLARD